MKLTYEIFFVERHGRLPSAALTTFNDELIARNGLFFDTRPFVRNPKEYAAFESPEILGSKSTEP
jgi:hypothetical protein